MQPLEDGPGRGRLEQRLRIGRRALGSGVGPTRDTGGGGRRAESGQLPWVAPADPGPTQTRREPAVHPPQPPRGAPGSIALDPGPEFVLDIEGHQPSRVQHPEDTTAMLDAQRVIGDHPVEGMTIEVAGDRLVIADSPDPLAGRPVRGGRGQGGAKAAPSPTWGGPTCTDRAAATLART